LAWQQAPVQPLWQHDFPHLSPQQAPQQPFAVFVCMFEL
jgi:hypothetical protein